MEHESLRKRNKQLKEYVPCFRFYYNLVLWCNVVNNLLGFTNHEISKEIILKTVLTRLKPIVRPNQWELQLGIEEKEGRRRIEFISSCLTLTSISFYGLRSSIISRVAQCTESH